MIPFESQREPQSCGAAALVMVYRSFGIDADQEAILRETERSRRAWRLAGHARRAGLRVLVARFRDGWEAVRRLREDVFSNDQSSREDAGEYISLRNKIRAILNHRLAPGTCWGHYSMLIGFLYERKHIVLHDPLLGPNRRWPRETAERLWIEPGGEIRGGCALLFLPGEATGNGGCFRCEKCGAGIDLDAFDAVLPCCERIFCPRCDHGTPWGTAR